MAELKTLRVCLSSELPSLLDRDPNFIYFLYDKLTVFLGQSLYSDPFAIVETMPENPIFNMLYFVLEDGKTKAYVDHRVIEIAEIENTDQLEILKQSGTTFFSNSEKRYLDLQRRIVTLPFQNGTYELTVSLANELKIDKDTVIGFNPETNTFEIIGKREDFDLVFTRGYRGKSTKSIDTQVSEHRVSGELKISKAYDNILRVLNDGLYANAKDKVTKKQFDSWVSSFHEYKSNMEYFIRDLTSKVGDSQELVNQETINSKILSALEEVYPEIDNALANFDSMAEQLGKIEQSSKEYSDKKFTEAQEELRTLILEITNNPWEDFGEVEISQDNGSDDTNLDENTEVDSGSEENVIESEETENNETEEML